MSDKKLLLALSYHSSLITPEIMNDELEKFLYWLPKKKRGAQTFRLGDTVRILSGPFAAFTGKVEGINQAKALLKVKVEIFGRETPVKLSFVDVKKVLSF
jgi:transcriptional antiterminator NusG